MSDDEKTVTAVNPVYPVTMNRTRRIDPFGTEERYPYYQSTKNTKKTAKKDLQKQATETCIVTSEKVDCKV